MNCQFFFYIFRKRKLQKLSPKSPCVIQSDKQIVTRYQNSADFCEIWPEHSLDVVKPKRVAHGELQCNAHRVFSAARTLQIN